MIIADPIPRLLTIAAAMTPAIKRNMELTLEARVPRGGGPDELLRHFGKDHEAAMAVATPVAVALDGMIPGFKDWLCHTGFGDDKLMVLTLLSIANYLAKFPKPKDARTRPAKLGPAPRFH